MRCLVSGATGFLGSHVVRYLAGSGYDVAALVRPRADSWRLADVSATVRFVEYDPHRPEAAHGAIASLAPDVVYHLGWAGVSKQLREDVAQTLHSIVSSIALLALALGAGARCWVGIGSQAEYARRDGPLTEDCPLRPRSVYGAAKLATALLAERLCASSRARFVWLRLFAAYGPADNADSLIPRVILALLKGERPALTRGEQRWDYLYAEDAAEAVARSGAMSQLAGHYNLASGQARSVRWIVERIKNEIDPRLELRYGDRPYENGRMMHLEGDPSRLNAALRWEPRVPMEDGIARTVRWFTEHRARYQQ